MTADRRLCGVADLEVEAGSVDLILTDPPYPREHDHLLDDLAALAASALLGRRFVGCDVDPSCLRSTEARLLAVDEYLASPTRQG